MKKSEFEGLVREIVQNELKTSMKRYVQAYVPIVVNEVVGDLIEKRLNEARKMAAPAPKRTKQSGGLSLNEIQEMVERDAMDPETEASGEEWPMIGNRPVTSERAPHWDKARLASMMGYDDMDSVKLGPSTRRAVSSAPITIDTIVTDKGTVIPINPNAIPEDLSAAFNRNYSDLMAKLNDRTR